MGTKILNSAEKTVRELFARAGIEVNGKRPWDIRIHNPGFFPRVLSQGSLGLGESYMDGWWDCEDLVEFFHRILRARLDEQVIPLKASLMVLKARILNLQNRARSWKVNKEHYDLGNELYECMLDKRMVYTCGYWEKASTLEDAQEAKLDIICRKLSLKPGQRVLDIGCGFGSFAKYAAEKYGAHVVGITLSKEQAEYAKNNCEGLPVEIRVQDYRALKGEKFDHIVSIGMFEAVGYKNFRTYMKIAHDCLKDDGLFLLHTIGRNTSSKTADAWFDKYIFPNGLLPSITQIGNSVEKLFVMEDWHNFGLSYKKTLLAWLNNFEKNWSKISSKYDERFYRMWRYYLLCSAGGFKSRGTQLWQILLSKKGILGGHPVVR